MRRLSKKSQFNSFFKLKGHYSFNGSKTTTTNYSQYFKYLCFKCFIFKIKSIGI